MKISNFKSGSHQSYKANGYQYFLPKTINHVFEVDNVALQKKNENASRLLGELSGMGSLVPNINLFIASFINNEATQSSKIEGTQTEIGDTFISEEDIFIEQKDDWEEVRLYIKAMQEAIALLDKLPLSNRLIKATHKTLLSSGRGSKKMPGEFRISQNWIGGTMPSNARFVPPHQEYVLELISDLDKFLNNNDNTPHLIKIGIAHYQFETIHPFLDGNGRIGRMLIPLYLVKENLLSQPLLYMSAFFEANKNAYYDKLDNVRKSHDLSDWLLFFLHGIEKSAQHGIGVLRDILALQKNVTDTISDNTKGSRRNHILQLLDNLFKTPFVRVSDISLILKVSPTTANKIIMNLIQLDILAEVDKKQRRNRLFLFHAYLAILRKPF